MAKVDLAPSQGGISLPGPLMWVGGKGGVDWAEQRFESGLVAPVVGTVPIWVALVEVWLDRRRPSPLLLGSPLAAGVSPGRSEGSRPIGCRS